MNKPSQDNHLIHKLVFEVTMKNQENNFVFQNTLSTLCKEKIVPVLDDVSSNVVKNDENIIINTLTLNLGRLSENDLKENLPNIIRARFSKALTEKVIAVKSSSLGRSNIRNDEIAELERLEPVDKYLTPEERLLDIFFHYIAKGYLPWWVAFPDSQGFMTNTIKHLEKHPDFFISILRRIISQNKPVELGRFISAFSDEQLREIQKITSINKKVTHPDKKIVAEIQKVINKKDVFLPKRLIYWAIVFSQSFEVSVTSIISKNDTPHYLKIAGNFFGDARIQDKHKLQSDKSDLTSSLHNLEMRDQDLILQDDDTDRIEIPINNSGLVLAAAFLGMLFKKISLINKEGFLSEYHRCKAVHLLQYLVAGNLDSEEFQLPLNKILCGMDVSGPIHKVHISKEEEKEADDLLASLIKHWSVLKNTSIAGLRTSFLQRPGILKKEEHAWRLRIERKSFDLLLEKLPWTISIIKLPWMSQPLDVEW